MSDKYICMKCKSAGAKSLVPFKIIEDKDGESVKFKGQFCKRCFESFMAPAPSTEEQDKEEN